MTERIRVKICQIKIFLYKKMHSFAEIQSYYWYKKADILSEKTRLAEDSLRHFSSLPFEVDLNTNNEDPAYF